MESTMSDNFLFLDSKKKIEKFFVTLISWRRMSRVFEVYEDQFSLWQGDKSFEDYYIHFKDRINELNQSRPFTNDIEIFLKRNVKNYMFVSFFSGSVLNSNDFEDNY